jgi:hypothetical protein
MNRINSLQTALKFLIGLQSSDPTLESISELRIPIRNGSLSADVYHPHHGESKGTIVTINGLAPLGNRDPRFIIVNKSLQKIGYTVVSPFYREICEFKISLRNVEDIKDSIQFIASDRQLTPTGKVSIFAPSFSGSLSLIAATDPEIMKLLDTICTVGAYGNVETIIENLFSIQELDEYGRLILLYNFLPISIGSNPSLFQAFEYAILDNYHKNKDNLFQPHFSKMKKKDQILFERIKNEPEFRIEHWRKIVKNGGKSRILLTELSVLHHISKLNLPILLVHGEKDDVVPPSESKLVYDSLQSRKVKSKLCITNLISHGDTGFSLKTVLEIPKIIDSFSFFFAHVR